MTPVEILMQEHRVIEVVLECLEKIAQNAEENGRLDREPAEQALDLIRNFADRCHHGKEEHRLFPAMVKRGIPDEGGPIGVMLIEHDMGRNHVRQMAECLDKAVSGDQAAVETFTAGAFNFIELLSAHIQKEDRILFPMADRVFSDDDQAKLIAEFNHVESAHMGEGTHEKYLKLVGELAAKYNISSSAIDHASKGGCCHHH